MGQIARPRQKKENKKPAAAEDSSDTEAERETLRQGLDPAYVARKYGGPAINIAKAKPKVQKLKRNVLLCFF
jgi:hypothetical protein